MPVRLVLSLQQAGDYPLAYSTESRDLPEIEARARVAAAAERLRPGSGTNTLWFKKVDGVLRGYPLAETSEDLRTATNAWRDRPGTLWAGSRGLAQALSPAIVPLQRPCIGLFVLGTSHPVTRAQALGLAGSVTLVADEDPIRPMAEVPLLLDPVPACKSGAETRASIARALDCLGEVVAELPLSRVVGDRLAGTTLVTKSGGFGEPDLLRAFLSSASESGGEQAAAQTGSVAAVMRR